MSIDNTDSTSFIRKTLKDIFDNIDQYKQYYNANNRLYFTEDNFRLCKGKIFLYTNSLGPLDKDEVRVLYVAKVYNDKRVAVIFYNSKGKFYSSSSWTLELGVWFEVQSYTANNRVCI